MSSDQTLMAMQRQIAALQGEIERLKTQEGGVGALPAFSVHKNGGDQSIAANTFTKVAWGTEIYDTTSVFADGRLTVVTPGLYTFSACVTFASVAAGAEILVSLYKNGASFKLARLPSGGGTYTSVVLPASDRAIATDYYEIYVRQTDSVSRNVYGSATNTWWMAQRVGE